MIVLRSGHRPQARLAAAVLVGESILTLVIGVVGYLNYTGASPDVDIDLVVTALFAVNATLYLGILATLRTPLVAWLRPSRWLLSIPIVGGVWIWFAFDQYGGEASEWLLLTILAVPAFAVVASGHAAIRAPRGTTARTQARWFLLAFGTRDILFLAFFIVTNSFSVVPEERASWQNHLLFATNPLAIIQLLYLPLLAYAVLRAQLFDLDLRVKSAIGAGTVSSVIVAAFFVASEMAQEIVGVQAGPIAGIAAGGALLLALHPLQRFGRKVADAALPGVNAGDEYVRARRSYVYRAAVESALCDGRITRAERTVLARLGGELALDPREMVAIEDEVLAVVHVVDGGETTMRP